MGREKNYSPEELAEIQKERILSDVALIKDGAKLKEGGRPEASAEQMESIKKEMGDEKKSENPEVKNLEELKQKAIEAGTSPEDIEALDAQLEMARMGADKYISKLEEDSEDDSNKETKDKISRDRKIGAMLLAASLGIDVGLWAIGGASARPIGVAASAGLTYGGLAMLGSPIARIQNWLERRKHEKKDE